MPTYPNSDHNKLLRYDQNGNPITTPEDLEERSKRLRDHDEYVHKLKTNKIIT